MLHVAATTVQIVSPPLFFAFVLLCCSPEHVNLQFSKKAVATSNAYKCSTQRPIKGCCSQSKNWPNTKSIRALLIINQRNDFGEYGYTVLTFVSFKSYNTCTFYLINNGSRTGEGDA